MLNKDFLSGQYQKTISKAFDSSKSLPVKDITGVIGALCFTGRVLEAKKLYKDQKQLLDEAEKSACRFFLGLGYTRKSKYKNASRIFHYNLSLLRKSSLPLQKFYVYQGIAFYLFFLGKLELSMKWALKSTTAALDAKDLYARSLSTDLMGHLKLRLGEINLGLDHVQNAEKLSKQLGNSSVSDAMEITILQYLAQYGYKRETILEELNSKCLKLVSEDNYSRAAIGLELARQLTLRGQYDKSEEILEQISINIFATENRRQEIQLNLRFAENFHRLGKDGLAWNYLRSAKRCLDFEADKSFEIQIKGFELKLYGQSAAPQLIAELKDQSKKYNSVINLNILSRSKISVGQLIQHEDVFHNFLVSLEHEDKLDRKMTRIIESGYYSLLADVLGIKKGESLFYFDQVKNRVILFYENKISVPSKHLTTADTKLLMAILSGKHSKDQLYKTVWGYDYEPLRHDNVIYTAMRSLRKNLEEGGSWIETDELGYHFKKDRKFKINTNNDLNSQNDEDSISKSSELSAGSFSSQLNLRQFKSLQYLKKNEFLDVEHYQKLHDVSEATASRDLRTLKQLGFVVSIGKARAIKYILTSNQ